MHGEFGNTGFGFLSQHQIVPCAYSSNVALFKHLLLSPRGEDSFRSRLVAVAKDCAQASSSGRLSLSNQEQLFRSIASSRGILSRKPD